MRAIGHCTCHSLHSVACQDFIDNRSYFQWTKQLCNWFLRGIHIETIFRSTAKLPRWCSHLATQIAKFMGPTWGPPGFCRPQMGPMLAPWTLLSGYSYRKHDCWCTGSSQAISNYVMNYVGSAVTVSQGRVSTNCTILALTNARKYKHIYMFPDIGLVRQLSLVCAVHPLKKSQMIYSRVPMWRATIFHNITHGTAMAAAERKSDFKLQTDTPYLALTCVKQLNCTTH